MTSWHGIFFHITCSLWGTQPFSDSLHKEPVTLRFETSYGVNQNKLLNKLSTCPRFETPWRSCDVIVIGCMVLTGGKIVVSMLERFIVDGVKFLKNVEPEMQRLHGVGHWKWISRKVIPVHTQDSSGKLQNEILYVFEVLWNCAD